MKAKILIKRMLFSLVAFLALVVAFTVYANVKVENASEEKFIPR